MSLYQSGWNPAGARKGWERCSMGSESTGPLMRRNHVPEDWGDPIESVAWFGSDDSLRILVADYANGRRAILRHRARDSQTTFTRAVSPQEMKG